MRRHLHNLFVPHFGNNHKPKILHHDSLTKLVVLILLFQLILTGITRVKPGVLGYASNISVTDILNLTNQEREKGGLDKLSFNETLANSARQKAAHMFANNYWAHTAPDDTTPWAFFKQAGYNYLYAGENLARDFGDSASVVQAWMNSQTHKDNIMSGRYTEIGVAVVNGILNGQETTLVVQHFGKPATVVASVSDESAQTVKGTQITPTVNPVPVKTEIKPEIAIAEPQVTALPKISNNKNQFSTQETGLNKTQTLVPSIVDNMPVFSTFTLTKSVNLALTILVIIVLVIDAIIIWHRGTQRRSGKSFIHLSLFALVALIIILTSSGRIM